MCFNPSNMYCEQLVDSIELGTGQVQQRVADENVTIYVSAPAGMVCIYLTPFLVSVLTFCTTPIAACASFPDNKVDAWVVQVNNTL